MSTKSSVKISLNPLHPGPAISQDFLGLSYETEQVLPSANGSHYFSPDNKPLIALFKTIGVKSLRIGGNSVDRPVTAIPNEADIDQLFAFAQAAGAQVIYSVRLQDGDPQSAANVARHIYKNYSQTLDCFAIGNEPAYFKEYETYRDKWKSIKDAIVEVAPGATFCGPDTNPNPIWCKNLADEFGKAGPLSMLTVHNYPGDCSYKNPGAADIKDLIPKDAAEAREEMLSPKWYSVYEKVHQGMADSIAGTSLPFRLAETNNFWYGGLHGASDTFAAALWSIDYLYWWAGHGAKGLNFHTGDRVGGGKTSLQSRYTAFVTSEKGYDIRPLSYGMKFFNLAGHGRLIPVKISPAPESLSAYATSSSEKSISLTLINKAYGPSAPETEIELHLESPNPIASARILFLTAPNHDIAATTGLTLGGKSIFEEGSWNGNWMPATNSSGQTAHP